MAVREFEGQSCRLCISWIISIKICREIGVADGSRVSVERNLPQVDQIKHSYGLYPDDPELKLVRIVAATTVTMNAMGMVDCWERFSSWTRLRRVVALGLIYRKHLLDVIRAKRDHLESPPMPTQDVEILTKAEDEMVK